MYKIEKYRNTKIIVFCIAYGLAEETTPYFSSFWQPFVLRVAIPKGAAHRGASVRTDGAGIVSRERGSASGRVE